MSEQQDERSVGGFDDVKSLWTTVVCASEPPDHEALRWAERERGEPGESPDVCRERRRVQSDWRECRRCSCDRCVEVRELRRWSKDGGHELEMAYALADSESREPSQGEGR